MCPREDTMNRRGNKKLYDERIHYAKHFLTRSEILLAVVLAVTIIFDTILAIDHEQYVPKHGTNTTIA